MPTGVGHTGEGKSTKRSLFCFVFFLAEILKLSYILLYRNTYDIVMTCCGIYPTRRSIYIYIYIYHAITSRQAQPEEVRLLLAKARLQLYIIWTCFRVSRKSPPAACIAEVALSGMIHILDFTYIYMILVYMYSYDSLHTRGKKSAEYTHSSYVHSSSTPHPACVPKII